jgi:hypothetical protein
MAKAAWKGTARYPPPIHRSCTSIRRLQPRYIATSSYPSQHQDSKFSNYATAGQQLTFAGVMGSVSGTADFIRVTDIGVDGIITNTTKQG